MYYSATGLPAGLSLDENTGIISGIITSGANTSSPYTTVLTADDGSYNASQTITWTVYPDLVSLANPGDQTNNDSDTVSLALSAAPPPVRR